MFPLDDNAVVCGFEAFINGKHVVGKVKEKETAHREYREAIQQGHGAYLMDQEKAVSRTKFVWTKLIIVYMRLNIIRYEIKHQF